MPATVAVTLTTNQLVVTLPNSDTMVHQAQGFTGCAVLRKPQYIYGTNTSTQFTATTNYWVRCHFSDERFYDIPMGFVSNQAGWTNDQAGANQCITDLTANLKVDVV
jgi:hypothetical protein